MYPMIMKIFQSGLKYWCYLQANIAIIVITFVITYHIAPQHGSHTYTL